MRLLVVVLGLPRRPKSLSSTAMRLVPFLLIASWWAAGSITPALAQPLQDESPTAASQPTSRPTSRPTSQPKADAKTRPTRDQEEPPRPVRQTQPESPPVPEAPPQQASSWLWLKNDDDGAPPTAPGRPAWQPILDVSLGPMWLARTLKFTDPYDPPDPTQHAGCECGSEPDKLGFDIRLRAYPLAWFVRGPLANIGLNSAYFRHADRFSTLNGSVDRVAQHLDFGIHYRWNILGRINSPTLQVGFGFNRLLFVIKDDEGTWVDIPDVAYDALRFALLDAEVPLYTLERRSSTHTMVLLQLGLLFHVDYLLVLSSGPLENNDPSGYGKTSAQGYDVGAGGYAHVWKLRLSVRWFRRGIANDFDNQCYPQLGCKAAGGADDVFAGLSLTLGVVL